MTVAELIKRLQGAPQDAVVLHMGSDEEYYEADEPEVERMHLGEGYYRSHWNGTTNPCRYCEADVPLVTVVKV